MTPINRAYIVNQLHQLAQKVHEGTFPSEAADMTDKEISRELARLADLADPDAGLFYLQNIQLERGKP